MNSTFIEEGGFFPEFFPDVLQSFQLSPIKPAFCNDSMAGKKNFVTVGQGNININNAYNYYPTHWNGQERSQ